MYVYNLAFMCLNITNIPCPHRQSTIWQSYIHRAIADRQVWKLKQNLQKPNNNFDIFGLGGQTGAQ